MCHRVWSSDPSYSFSTRQTSSESPWDVEFESTYMPTYDPQMIYVSCAASDRQPADARLLACMRIGNRILGELKSTESGCIETEFILWHSTTTLQGRGGSHDGLWAISHADGQGTGSRCLHRQGVDNGGSHEQYCTWLHMCAVVV